MCVCADHPRLVEESGGGGGLCPRRDLVDWYYEFIRPRPFQHHPILHGHLILMCELGTSKASSQFSLLFLSLAFHGHWGLLYLR